MVAQVAAAELGQRAPVDCRLVRVREDPRRRRLAAPAWAQKSDKVAGVKLQRLCNVNRKALPLVAVDKRVLERIEP